MYTLLKTLLFRRLKKLKKKKAKLENKIENLNNHRYNRKYILTADKEIEKLTSKIKIIDAEIEITNEELEYFAKDKPNNVNKLVNNSVNVGKNDSGPKIEIK